MFDTMDTAQSVEYIGIMLREVVDALNVFSDCVYDEFKAMGGVIPEALADHYTKEYNAYSSVLSLSIYKLEQIAAGCEKLIASE